MYPDGDGSYSCGSSGHRWKYVYASNGINTGSDEYIKENNQKALLIFHLLINFICH